jgi:membrane associated rhomboid family serine protease
MLIIPLTGSLSKKNPPILTIGIIAVCCFVFFVIQSGDTRKYEQAQEFYFDSGLYKIELSAYFTYVRTTRQDKSAEVLARKQNWGEQAIVVWYQRMMQDAEFQTKLLNEEIIRSDQPGFPEWKQLRTQYDQILSRVIAVRYGFRPAFPTYFSPFTYMFLHGGFGHLLGNMIFLWLVGCALELGYGRVPYAGLYLLTGVLAVGLYCLVYTTNTAPLIGASGAIAGLMGAYTILYGRRKIKVFYSLGFYFNYTRVPALILLPLWIGNECFQLFFGGASHVAYVAHLGGLASGALLGFVVKRCLGAAMEPEAVLQDSREEQVSLLDEALEKLGKLDMDGARVLLERVLEKDPGNTKALTHLFHIDKLQPESERFHATASRLFLRLINDKAEHGSVYAIFQEYVRLAPRLRLDQQLLFRISSVFAAQGHPEDGERIMAVLLRSHPGAAGIPTGILNLARAYLHLGKSEKGRKCLQVICRKYPESSECHIARKLLQGQMQS